MARYSTAKMTAYMVEYREKRRKWARELLGNKCSVCGSRKNLEFDHIDPKTKIMAIGKMWHASWAALEAEVLKCQLLCKKHHLEKSRTTPSVRKPGVGKPLDLTNLQCPICKVVFTRPTWRIRQREKQGCTRNFCSRQCSNIGRTTR